MTIQEAKAHEEKISAQVHEARALFDEVEAHAKKNKAQAEIEKLNALKTKKQEIEQGWHRHLKTAGEAALALKIKSEIEADLAKFKSSLEEVAAKLKSQPSAN
jgi:hypothetical protein